MHENILNYWYKMVKKKPLTAYMDTIGKILWSILEILITVTVDYFLIIERFWFS